MGALQLVAVVALHERRGGEGEMRATLALTRLRDLALGDTHADELLMNGFGTAERV
jgi:hypothetical protein